MPLEYPIHERTLANGLRVALISALAHWEFTSALHGPMHVLHGLFVAAVGYVVLFLGFGLGLGGTVCCRGIIRWGRCDRNRGGFWAGNGRCGFVWRS